MNALKYILVFYVVFGWLPHTGFSQTEEQKLVREGNKLYEQKKFSEAEKNYLDALSKQANSFRGAFNLGNTYYRQGKYKEAAAQFEMLAARKSSNDTLSKVYHNLGNAYLKQKEYEKSINAYKNALKRNNADEDSMYNLAYAQKMLKQQQEQQKQDQEKKDKEKKKDKNKEKEKDKNKDKNEEKNKEKQQEQQKQQQQKQEISKEDAQRLLEAMNNDEKKLREKMNQQKVKGTKIKIEKDW